MSNARRIDTAECSKMVRKALKNAFPGHKFSVKTDRYSGGSSVDVNWTDGPTLEEVQKVAKRFEGASFDGMVDLKSHHDSLLSNEDGSVERVSFGADYVICQRGMSDGRRDEIAAELVEFHNGIADVYNWTPITLDDARSYAKGVPCNAVRPSDSSDGEAHFSVDNHSGNFALNLVYRVFSYRSFKPAPKAEKVSVK